MRGKIPPTRQMWELPNHGKINGSMSHSVQNSKRFKNQLIKIFLESLTPD
ncbi:MULTISPECIES: hypothetical protein [Leptospira]|uniref:Uncharacterized protein n=3 Tax=Leptospira weilii TaxID=28184 RepID=A0A828YXI3_9LEPT|nr:MULTISPECIES: hypothetical protein [Leptospira]EKR63272.1 hypothetical protein LEP1GSC036_3190 [Leptospira weilii str. 2006001853]EMN91054.1 hypothetical protein LEP1GSC108_4365 [Leptospira weilii str. UI 13098]EMY14251.1 hypothetical protein LEP1GSC043_2152 [Leptospira weilii str. Ecochallenge]MCL8266235.1 hypothetical protein [Leptospira weilii]